MSEPTLITPIDHIVWAVPDLNSGMEQIEELTGTAPVYGGRHLHFGTHNALLKLGNRCYFEILAPDPANKDVPAPRWMGVDLIDSGQITRWALASSNLAADVEHLATVNKDLANTTEGQRLTGAGDLLRWQLSIPLATPLCETAPFLIDWQDSVHPATNLSDTCSIVDFKITDPNAEQLRHLLKRLQSNVEAVDGPSPKLTLTLKTPKGIVTIS